MEFTKNEKKGLMLIGFFTGECKNTVFNHSQFVEHEKHFNQRWKSFKEKSKKNKVELVGGYLESLVALFPSQTIKKKKPVPGMRSCAVRL